MIEFEQQLYGRAGQAPVLERYKLAAAKNPSGPHAAALRQLMREGEVS